MSAEVDALLTAWRFLLATVESGALARFVDLLTQEQAKRYRELRPVPGIPEVHAAIAELKLEADEVTPIERPDINAPRRAYEEFRRGIATPSPEWDSLPREAQDVWARVSSAARRA